MFSGEILTPHWNKLLPSLQIGGFIQWDKLFDIWYNFSQLTASIIRLFFVKLDFKHYKFKIQLILGIFSTEKKNDHESQFMTQLLLEFHDILYLWLACWHIFFSVLTRGGDENKRLLNTGRAVPDQESLQNKRSESKIGDLNNSRHVCQL